VTGQPQLIPVRELFDGRRRFRVPIYQRAYAWGKVEIEHRRRPRAQITVAGALSKSSRWVPEEDFGIVPGGPVRPGEDAYRRLRSLDGSWVAACDWVPIIHFGARRAADGYLRCFLLAVSGSNSYAPGDSGEACGLCR
jgi:hypothetical protein